MQKKKLIKSVGDQLFIKKSIKSPWEPAKNSDLKSKLSERLTPFSSEEKLELPQFGFGMMKGVTKNKQLYPTKYIVAELDTPAPFKGRLNENEVFEKWSSTFRSVYREVLRDNDLPFWSMYLTPSMCGLRFIVRLKHQVNDEAEYKKSVSLFLHELGSYGANESYHDIKVNCGWFVPTFKKYFILRKKIFRNQIENEGNESKRLIYKAIRLTEDVKVFENGNRNSFIYFLARNSNRLGIRKNVLLEYISQSDFAYDMKEICTTVESAYKKVEDAGIWANKPNIEVATVSLMSLFERSKRMKPVPKVWSGIKKGSLGFVFGPSKSGKSTLCECLGMSLAVGLTEFCGLPLSGEQAKILYISLEEYWENRIERNKSQRGFLFISEHKKLGDNFFTNNENFPNVIQNDSDLKFIENEINKCEPEIVFIDSFTRLLTDKVEDSSRTNIMMQRLRKMCNDTGATFALIHHTTKAKDKSLSILNMAGSRVLSQEADFLIGVNRAPNGQRYIKDVAFRYAKESEKVIPFDINDNRWIIAQRPVYESELLSAGDGRKDDANKQSIYAYFKSVDNQVSIADLKEHFNNEMSKKTLHNNLKKLIEEGKIEKIEKGVYKCSVANNNK